MFKEQESNEMLGIGNEVVKFIGKDSDDVICYIGKQDDKDVIWTWVDSFMHTTREYKKYKNN